MTVLTTVYTQAGFTTTVIPPRPGIYYTSVAIYNPLSIGFSVQNGVNQNTIPPEQAQLFKVPSTGSPPSLSSPFTPYPYGTYTGPVQAVWFDPTDTPGSYPTPLGALGGIIQWTNPISLGATSVYVATTNGATSITVVNMSNVSATVSVYGIKSGVLLGTAFVAANSSGIVPIATNSTDSSYSITSSSSITATLTLSFGISYFTGSHGLIFNSPTVNDPWTISGFLSTDTTALISITNTSAGGGGTYYPWLTSGATQIIGSPALLNGGTSTYTFTQSLMGANPTYNLQYGSASSPTSDMLYAPSGTPGWPIYAVVLTGSAS